MPQPFHYAFFVRDLSSTRRFYGQILGCTEGRSTETWVDFDFFGNQISAHTTGSVMPTENTGQVEGIRVPMPPFRGAAGLGCVFVSGRSHSRRGSPFHSRAQNPLCRDSRESRRRCSSWTPAGTRSSSRASDIRSTSSPHEDGLGRHHWCRRDRRERSISPRPPRLARDPGARPL